MLWLLLWLLVPTLAWSYTFDPTVLNIPSLTYGTANEACETPSGSDITLNPGGAGAAWETALESATPGQRFFLNAGTYTSSMVILPNGNSSNRIQIKPNNCAAVTINGRIQVGSYNTLAGLTLSHLTGSINAWGLTGTVIVGPSNITGTIIRNNFITADDHYAIYLRGVNSSTPATHTTITIQGNELRFPAVASPLVKWIIVYPQHNICNNCVMTQNKFISLGMESDYIQAYHWGGSWTISRNWFTSPGPNQVSNHFDIKYSIGFNDVMHFTENYLDGTNFCSECACALTHNASDIGVGPGQYAYTVNVKGNYFTNCHISIWDHRISTRSQAEIDDVNSRTVNFTYNVFYHFNPANPTTCDTTADPNNTPRVLCESNNCLVQHNTFIGSCFKTGSGSWVPSNVVVRDNIFYRTVFQNPSRISTCSHNDLFAVTASPTCANSVTGNPLFVNVNSDWNLQTGSPARNKASDGLDMGAYGPPTVDFASGLVLHLKFDENTGTTAQDSTAGNHDGTLDTGASWGVPKLGVSSVALDGTTDGVVTVSGLLDTPANITLAAWFKRSAFPTSEGDLLSLGNNVALRQSASAVKGQYFMGSVHSVASASVSAGTTDWHHLVYTVTPGFQALYLDGVQVAFTNSTVPISYTSANGPDTVLGRHGGSSTTFRYQGLLDDVRVYNRALTASDVAGLYAFFDPPPLAVQITSPTTNDSHSVSSATLTNFGGQATDNVGVTGVTWTCPTCTPTSGTATCLPACGAATTATAWNVPTLTLGVGTNVLTAQATDASGAATDQLTVTYTVPPPVGSCTHYAGPPTLGGAIPGTVIGSAGNNGLSTATPFRVADFWAQAVAGSTLCLLNGTYNDGNAMILPPTNKTGAPTSPITVQALNDGMVLLDGQNVRNPVVLTSTNQWLVIQGMNATNGLTAVYQFLGSNNRGKRLVGWNGTSGQLNAVVFEVQGANTIVEDCAAWGQNARTILQGSGTQVSTGSGYRRCWAEWNDHPEGGTTAPSTLRLGAGQRYENVLGTYNKVTN